MKNRKKTSPLRIRKVTNHNLQKRPKCPEGFEPKKINGNWVCARKNGNDFKDPDVSEPPLGPPPSGVSNWFYGSGGGNGGGSWNTGVAGGGSSNTQAGKSTSSS